ncbi:hypothetical protein [Oceanobacillus manasiensis]|nr:hypothetical protein [Oceanobacillus manasiensis]
MAATHTHKTDTVDRKYFELETFYDEYCKPIKGRRLPMVQQPDE